MNKCCLRRWWTTVNQINVSDYYPFIYLSNIYWEAPYGYLCSRHQARIINEKDRKPSLHGASSLVENQVFALSLMWRSLTAGHWNEASISLLQLHTLSDIIPTTAPSPSPTSILEPSLVSLATWPCDTVQAGEGDRWEFSGQVCCLKKEKMSLVLLAFLFPNLWVKRLGILQAWRENRKALTFWSHWNITTSCSGLPF